MDYDDDNMEFDVPHSTSLLKALDDGNECDLLSDNVDVNFLNNRNQTPLYLAVRNQNIPVIKLLLDKGCDVNTSTMDGDTAFIHSLYHYSNDNSTITSLLLQSDNLDINLPPLSMAHLKQSTQLAFIDFIRLLIYYGADFLTQSGNNKLQLVHHLLCSDALPLVRKIIDAGVYIGAVTQHGENIYHLLAKYCEDGGVDYSDLILHNIDLHFQNQEGNSPLMIASFLHNKSFIQYFIDESRCNMNIQNGQGHTALHLCIIGFTAIIKSLDCRKSEEFRNQLCDFTYYPNFIGCVNLLINAGIDVNIKDNDGKTALMRAVMTNDKNLVENLLKSNSADITILDDYGRAAIQYFNFADCSKDLECFKLLYAKGGNDVLNLPQINGQTIIQLPHLRPECEIPRSLNNDRFMRNQENNCNVNYNLYDYDGKWLDYEHIQYLNIQSFYNFS